MRVALVDPSRTNRMIVARLLQARNHEVLPFEDAPQALRRVKLDHQVNALITSAELPSMSGMELCWETRLLANSRRLIYVLLMSSNREGLIEALDSGADDFISKPPVAEELYARLRAAERIESLQNELIRLATTDPLTGLNNRREFFERADAALREAEQSGSLSAILIDIDSFKAVNDLFGHHTGDEAIRAIAIEAQHDQAIVGRLGGDEFSILLREPLAEALSLAESLRRRFGAVRLKTADGELSLTCSLGISELEANDTIDSLIGRADMALYRAKEEGRNRVATPPSPAWIEEHPRRTGPIARTTAR